MKLLLSFIVIFFMCNSSTVANKARLSNSYQVRNNQFPSLARINADFENFATTCSGSILSKNWVLTAAHCLKTTQGLPRSISVFTGSAEKYASYERKVVVSNASYYVHFPDYYITGGYVHDIALIHTPDIKLDQNVSVALLPRNEIAIGQNLTTAGWGTLVPKGPSASKAQWNVFTVVYSSLCDLKYLPLLDNRICVHSKTASPCPGDSGGPIQYGKEVIGVSAYTIDIPPIDGNLGVYTKVLKYLGWIKKTMTLNN